MKYFGLFIVSLLFSCSHSRKVNENTAEQTSWDAGRISRFEAAGKSFSDTSRATIDYMLARPDAPLKRITDSLVASYLGLECCKDGSQQVTSRQLEAYADVFLSEYIDLTEQDSSATFPWYMHAGIDFCLIDNAYVKADFSMETYTGGAHGNANFTTYMIDVETATIVRLEDICTNIPELEKRAEAVFRKTYGMNPKANWSEEGFWFTDNVFHLNRNFSFENKTLTFVFNQYEIAPYSMGVFYIELPFSEINDLLKIKK